MYIPADRLFGIFEGCYYPLNCQFCFEAVVKRPTHFVAAPLIPYLPHQDPLKYRSLPTNLLSPCFSVHKPPNLDIHPLVITFHSTIFTASPKLSIIRHFGVYFSTIWPLEGPLLRGNKVCSKFSLLNNFRSLTNK